MRFKAIHAQRRDFPVPMMCAALGVSRSGYHSWQGRRPSSRSVRDQVLRIEVAAAFKENRGVYGRPRLTSELNDAGIAIGQRRVSRLMREQSLYASLPRRFRKTTDSNHERPCARNIVDRKFYPKNPNEIWAADITYIQTTQGWAYLAVIIDLFSRRVVGWAMADHMKAELAEQALRMAIRNRTPPRGLVHHSDRGAQYASHAYRLLLARHGLVCSMSGKGDCWDNAVVESFFGTLKTELLYRQPLSTILAVTQAVGDYINNFYNSKRRHSTLGNVSPTNYERNQMQPLAA